MGTKFNKLIVFIYLFKISNLFSQSFYIKPSYSGALYFNNLYGASTNHVKILPAYTPSIGTYIGYINKKNIFFNIGRRTMSPSNKIRFDTEGTYPENGKTKSSSTHKSTNVTGGGIAFFDNDYQYIFSIGYKRKLKRKFFIEPQINFIQHRRFDNFSLGSSNYILGTDTLKFGGYVSDSMNYWARQLGISVNLGIQLTNHKSISFTIGYNFPTSKPLQIGYWNYSVNNKERYQIREENKGRTFEFGIQYTYSFELPKRTKQLNNHSKQQSFHSRPSSEKLK